MAPRRWTGVRLWALLAPLGVIALAGPPPARAQGTGRPTVSSNRDGYIDGAIPGDQFRLRFDAAYDDRRPNRAEFFYPQGRPLGPGLPRPEPRVDFQELTGYLEVGAAERLSGFVEVPWRFLNPEVNANHNGLGDVSAGFKYAVIDRNDLVTTFQLRTYAPTGDAGRGLGTDHVSLEPAVLIHAAFTERFGASAELRYWVPVGGTDFAGDVLRYGVGLQYDLFQTPHTLVTPLVEFIGWTALGGKETVVRPSGLASAEGAAGDTILNVKLGVRVKVGSLGDVYTGYGRPLTGTRWYENIYRVEFRIFF